MTDEFTVCSTANGLILTGLGIFDDLDTSVFHAPLDTNNRSSDADFEPGDDNAISVLLERPFQGRYGFVFHDACWSLLQEAAKPASVSLQRIFDVCASLPVPRSGRYLSWGHDFGGTVVVDDMLRFPWEERERLQNVLLGHPVFPKDPYPAPEVDFLLAEEPLQPPAWRPTAPPAPGGLGVDCLQSLPGELCSAIAVLLPTPDLLRARLASRAFWPIFYSQQFWASRFHAHGDRAWFLEARDRPPTDWRALYRQTNRLSSPGLRNRQRIWALSQQVLHLVSLAWNDAPPDLPGTWLLDSAPPRDHLNRRVEISGLLYTEREQLEGRLFHNGCRLVRTQSIAVPDALVRLSVDTAAFGDGGYIVGMTLTTASGCHVRLGYSSDTRQCVDVSQLRGFHLAVGSRGIQGLQCITRPGDGESPWLGSWDNVPRTDRLAVADRVVRLEAGFDVGALDCRGKRLVQILRRR